MEKSKVDMFLVQHSDKFAATDLPRVRMMLERIPDSEFLRLSTLDLKSPTMTLVLALALGSYGVGAFYVKKIGFGIVQVLVCLAYIFFAIAMSVMAEFADEEGMLIALVVVMVLFFALLALMLVLIIISAVKAKSWTHAYNINKFQELVRY